MKFLYYIVLLIAITTVSCSRNRIVLVEDELPEDVFYLKNSIEPYTGKCIIYYSGTDQIKEELNFKNGIQNGEHISYYPCGSIKRKGTYKNGDMNGVWTLYSKHGSMLYEVNYQNDTLSGNYRSWYPTGVPCKKGKYLDNKKTGKWIYYDEAGMITKSESL